MSLGFTLWNMEDGFVDGLLRGWRSTFLSDTEYANLKEGGKRGGAGAGLAKEDFEDMRLALQETDYGTFLAAEPALDPKLIGLRATAKWVREMRYARASATGEWRQGRRSRYSLFLSRAPPCARRPSRLCRACACVHCTLSRVLSSPRVLSPRAPLGTLARFLDFVAYEYMIDNILDLIKAATSSQTVDAQAVVSGCHPLGLLDESVMKSILAFEDLGEDFHALYRTVLVDTPVGCVAAAAGGGAEPLTRAPLRAAHLFPRRPRRRPRPARARAASTLRNFCARWPRRARRRTLSTCARRLRRSPCR